MFYNRYILRIERERLAQEFIFGFEALEFFFKDGNVSRETQEVCNGCDRFEFCLWK